MAVWVVHNDLEKMASNKVSDAESRNIERGSWPVLSIFRAAVPFELRARARLLCVYEP